MNVPEPSENTITIYTKSECVYCDRLKEYLQKLYVEYNIVACDDFLVEREEFLLCMEKKIGKRYDMFPMVFYHKQFIGGYTDTVTHMDQLFFRFNDSF